MLKKHLSAGAQQGDFNSNIQSPSLSTPSPLLLHYLPYLTPLWTDFLPPHGTCVFPRSTPYIWSPECLASWAEKVSVTEITPNITMPLSSGCLSEVVGLLEKTMRHNAMSAILFVGDAVMSCDTITQLKIISACIHSHPATYVHVHSAKIQWHN